MYQNKAWRKETILDLDPTGKPLEKPVSKKAMRKEKKKEKREYFKNLEEVPKLKKLGDEPIFYHHDDCDCIKCRARREKGGLDYDPSNDDAEFEEHERQVFRDVGIDEEEGQ